MLTCFLMPLPNSAADGDADGDEDRVLRRLVPGLKLMRCRHKDRVLPVPGLGLMPLPDSAADGEEKMPLPDSAAVESRFWLEIRFLVGPRGRPQPRFAYYKKLIFATVLK
jgi:hypothetical protein